MKAAPGTYVLVLRSQTNAKVRIGRWGHLDVAPGFYLYAGSAFGPGGIQARVSRHHRRDKRRHWHIDYLGDVATPCGAWYSHETARLEHRWAQVLSRMDGMSAIPGFGCSDCGCHSHLFQTSREPDFGRFSELAGGEIAHWSCRPRVDGATRG